LIKAFFKESFKAPFLKDFKELTYCFKTAFNGFGFYKKAWGLIIIP